MNQEPNKRSHISFSELKIWDECPYKHKLVYLDKVKKFKGNEHTAFGTAMHYICENLVQGQEEDLEQKFNIKFLEELRRLKESNVDLNKSLVKDMRAQGKPMFSLILPELNRTFSSFELISVEEELMVPLAEGLSFKGYIDLVIKAEDKYHIIDWKTCSWGWNTKRKTDRMTTYQLTLYKHFFAQKHSIDPSDIDTHFALLKRTAKTNNVEIFCVPSGVKKTDNALKLLKKSIYNIENEIFLKNRLSCTSGYGCEFNDTKYCTR
jgi:ATP-dependent exoDNAse (exonuclease V) beta subunit